LYFSYRNPKTGKLERQTNIKGDANKYLTKKERYSYLLVLQSALLKLLQFGFNPYEDNEDLEIQLFESKKKKRNSTSKVSEESRSSVNLPIKNGKSISKAIK